MLAKQHPFEAYLAELALITILVLNDVVRRLWRGDPHFNDQRE